MLHVVRYTDKSKFSRATWGEGRSGGKGGRVSASGKVRYPSGEDCLKQATYVLLVKGKKRLCDGCAKGHVGAEYVMSFVWGGYSGVGCGGRGHG